MFTYLLINLCTLAGPLARSFEPRIQFWKRWPALFPAIGITLAVFVVWDALFTQAGVWGFTSAYLVGFRMLHLPVEEWLFFVTVPYACVFIYEVLNHFVKRDILGAISRLLAWGLIALAVLLILVFPGRLYTLITCVLLVVLLLVNLFCTRPAWLGRFFLGYAVSLVPFLLVNGILTGAVTAAPVVWYNDAENMGIRLLTIPLEDFLYGMDLMLLNVMLYEAFKRRWRIASV
jgi:lycopene cyclase domain-containing protein